MGDSYSPTSKSEIDRQQSRDQVIEQALKPFRITFTELKIRLAQEAQTEKLHLQARKDIESAPGAKIPCIGKIVTSGRHAVAGDYEASGESFKEAVKENAIGFGAGKLFSVGFKYFGVARGVGPLAGYGDDLAISQNSANLTSKRGWFDVVVHGTEDGLGFTMNGTRISPQQLYNHMLENGYQAGTKIRLMSCYSGSMQNGAASQLSKIANAQVMAPTGALSIFPKGSFMVNYGQQFYIESSGLHETGKMILFK